MSVEANLYQRFAAGFRPHAVALELGDGTTYTCSDIEAHSARAANALLGCGLKAGDRVSVMCEKSAELVWLYLGCLRAGLVYHPLNTGYTARELGYFFDDAGTRLVVTDPGLEQRVTAALEQTTVAPRVEILDARGGGAFATLCAAAASSFETHSNAGDDTAALLYSSGTTGTPKGIPLSHDNLYVNARALVAAWAFSADDILVHALPLYHVHGLFITLGPALLAGTRIRLLPKFETAAVIKALAGATMMAGVPTYYTRLLADDTFTRDAAGDVRVFISGSAPLTEATFAEFLARTGHTILERYGMTETGINTSNPLHGERRAGSVGLPLAGTEVQVVDADRRCLEAGQIGAIEVRGANVFAGYWQLPDKTAEAFSADGWFHTGDQGLFDADGYLHIVGRSKDMVISGGLNVYPKEIEQVLDTLPGVAESAVFGVPHADFGEAVVAAVIRVPGSAAEGAALIEALKHELAAFKVPKHIVFIDELPRNAMGKVQKNLLRDRYAGLFAGAA